MSINSEPLSLKAQCMCEDLSMLVYHTSHPSLNKKNKMAPQIELHHGAYICSLDFSADTALASVYTKGK